MRSAFNIERLHLYRCIASGKPNKDRFRLYLNLAHEVIGKLHTPGRHYARTVGYRANVNGTRRAKQDLRRLLGLVKEDAIVTPARAWNSFEAYRLSGVSWSSGIFGLAVAGYAHELIGLHYALSTLVSPKDPKFGTFTNFVIAANAAALAPVLSHMSMDDVLVRLLNYPIAESNNYSGLSELADAAWIAWRAMPRDLAELCRVPDFPAVGYAWALKDRDAAAGFFRDTASQADIVSRSAAASPLT